VCMKNRMPLSAQGLPVACTLNDEQFQSQCLEWPDLNALSLSAEKIVNGMSSTYPLELLDQIEDLASRESSCCGSWLSIDVRTVDDVVRLTLTTSNPEGLAVINAMAGVTY